MVVKMWKACEEPERPPDPFVVWCEQECYPCALKLEVVNNDLDPLDPDHQADIRAVEMLLNRVAPESGEGIYS